MYGIELNVYKNLIDYFKTNKDIQQVILFGSRAKGLAQATSDIDLCITYTGTSKGTLVFDIEDKVGIYSLDIVFKDSISEELTKQIQRDGQVIYTRSI